MALRRQKMIGIGLMLFVLWNVAAYLLFARQADQGTKPVDASQSLNERLQRLQEQMKDQMQINEQLLQDIMQQKEAIIKSRNLSPNQPDVAKVDMVVHQQEPQPPQTNPFQLPLAKQVKYPYSSYTIPVLMIACNRPEAIRRSLTNLLQIRPSSSQFPVIVSQDCGHQATAEEIQKFGSKVTHIKQPDLSSISLPAQQKKFEGYYKIARHYKWALNKVFHEFNYDAVIIVEDDLDVSIDFFEYFLATYPLLQEDPTLWCVSAWNDNGKDSRISDDAELLYRSDFFPGLGWMMRKEIWLELESKWPQGFWDDWMRDPAQRKDRACIRPEISRTDTFGKVGVSRGQFFEQHLKYIKLNKKSVAFTKLDLSLLKKENFDPMFKKAVYGAPEVTMEQLKQNTIGQKAVRVTYTNKNSFKLLTKQLGIMQDLKSGVPRAGYMGVVSFMFNGHRVYLAPTEDWKGYDHTWS
ncbi:alpha-1,3-mannosyl-glycoprotein 2-beta-N-acetylglucosaminyltransferase-like isoform X2 [Acanthaster planci]|uniref:Alpha-1,3-mannosyl-glycoprotein 2-beta-N-acetylglucosaminyltransferase n=1 Tax=Acanthaster planci TaxID=133434 RepID=A0A8B7Z4C0_ACAPL|nr:alpha-1,3-mannosyl-glycoprotein 2-beta-N-acetylglucosaminyltransferase-like isoform X2 [Acanthaster planci]